MKRKNKIELLSPAGSLEKMKYAFHYGADAVYLGVPDFSLRARVNRFSENEIKEAIVYAHKIRKRIYVAVNIYAHNQHLKKIIKHLKFLRPLRPDGVIVSDPGIINLVKKYLPETEIHLSTQANATNLEAVKFWQHHGVKRVILAREVTLPEIKEIKKAVPEIELEYFIHGAMCMSYSGRCILSKWMNDRSANLGDCSQPCRWSYRSKIKSEKLKIKNVGVPLKRDDNLYKLEVVDDQERFGMDVEEDQHGTYFFNSRDLNLIEHIKSLVEAGVSALKIEGRAKSAYYAAIVTRSYRKVLDAILKNKKSEEIKKIIKEQKKELDNLVNRGYTTGFLLGKEPEHNFSGELTRAPFEFVGEIRGKEGRLNLIKVHNTLFASDSLEAVTPEKNIKVKIKRMLDDNKKEITEAHGGHTKLYYVEFDKILPEMALIRKKSI